MNDEFPSYYSITPAPVRYDKRLTANQKLLYGEITALANKDGYCYATNKYFARLYECTEQTISASISNLQKCGYIYISIEENYKRKIYIVPLKENLKGVSKKFEGGIKKTLKGVSKKFEDNNTSTNNTLNNKNEYKNNTNVLFDQQELVEPEKPKSKISEIMEAWNRLPITNIKAIRGTRLTMLKARLKDYTIDEILSAISNIRESPFLLGQNNKGWQITFDWFIRPNNFLKVYEGNYTGQRQTKNSTSWNDAQAGYEGAMQDLEGLIDE